MSSPPAEMQIPPIENFLATVLDQSEPRPGAFNVCAKNVEMKYFPSADDRRYRLYHCFVCTLVCCIEGNEPLTKYLVLLLS